MAETNFRGPIMSMGSLEETSVGPFDGPSLLYQNNVVIDPRYSPVAKDGVSPARVLSFMNSADIVVVDNFISARNASTIATGINSATTTIPTGGIAITFNATAVAGGADNSPGSWNPGIPIIPFGSSTPVAAFAIDFGFTTGTTTAASSTVVVPDSSKFYKGQWLVIGGAGNTANTTSLITQVSTTLNATTINISPAAVGALSLASIGNANLFSQLAPPATQFTPSPTPNAATPYIPGGLAAVFDPIQGVARGLSITASTTVGTGTVLVSGWDIYGQPMTELLSSLNGTTNYGNKAFKYVKNAFITALSTTNVTFTIGVSDVVGINVRCDKWEYLGAAWKGASVTNNNGWTAAFTAPATATTGDVRGTLQISTAGALATSVVAALSNGTSRIWMQLAVPAYNLLNANAVSTTSMFGVTQA